MRALAISLLLVAAPAQAARYTLGELTTKVANEFPAVSAAREGLASAEAALKGAQFAWLPTGDMTLYLSGSPDVKCLAPGETTPNADQAIRERNCFTTSAVSLSGQLQNDALTALAPVHGLLLRFDVTLNQSLYSFGRTESNIALQKAAVDNARANLERERAEAVWNISRAYWGLKTARAAVDTIQEGLTKLREWIDKVDEQLNGKNKGRFTESDLARMKLALANAELLLLDQQRNQDYAAAALKYLTNDPQAEIDAEELTLVEAPVPEALEEWQTLALKLRPEIRQLDAAVDTSESLRKLRTAELAPDILFNSWFGIGVATAMDTPQNYYLGRTNYMNATFGLLLKQPLDFGVRTSRFRQARADKVAAVARKRAALTTYRTEIAKAWADYEEAKGRAQQTGRGEKISRGWYTAISQNVTESDGRELIEALQNYFLFRLRHFQATYDANIALAWLQRTTGSAQTRR